MLRGGCVQVGGAVARLKYENGWTKLGFGPGLCQCQRLWSQVSAANKRCGVPASNQVPRCSKL